MIAIGSDHGGYLLKEELKKHLEEKGIEFKDFGTDSAASCDYPVYAEKVCRAIQSGECEKGILICGTGIGMSMCANKCKGIRAALCGDHFSAEFTRKHNDANVLCMGARTIGPGVALQLADIFLTTEFEGGRHEKRVSMMMELENK
ncbi:MAG: ribose 5-phosphate isomerase B [Oscillospiraceae bacterium]